MSTAILLNTIYVYNSQLFQILYAGSYLHITEEIEKYITEQQIMGVPSEDKLPRNILNFFRTHKGIYYPLTEAHLDVIYAIITTKDASVNVDVEKIRNKNNTVNFVGLHEALSRTVQNLKSTLEDARLLNRTPALAILLDLFINLLNKPEFISNLLLVRIIQKTLGEILLNGDSSAKNEEDESNQIKFSCLFITLSSQLGLNIFNVLTGTLNKNYYNLLYLHLYHNIKYTEDIKNNNFHNKTHETIKLKSVKTSTAIINHLKTLLNEKLLSDIFYAGEQQRLDNFTVYHLILNQISFDLGKTEQKFLLSTLFNPDKLEMISYQTQIGAQFVEQMLKEGILTNLQDSRKFKDATLICIANKYKEELLLSLAHQKPFLYQKQQQKVNKTSTFFQLNTHDVHEGYAYSINLTEKLKEINISSKLQIKGGAFLSDFMFYFDKILFSWENKDFNQDLQVFLEMIYDIDLDTLRTTDEENHIFQDVIDTCCNFKESYNSSIIRAHEDNLKEITIGYKKFLKEYKFRGFDKRKKVKKGKKVKKIKNDFSLIMHNDDEVKAIVKSCYAKIKYLKKHLHLLNKLNHKKHFLIHMLNDVLLYNHFGGFFLGTYISYTGRRFNLNYFLNLQGSKIVSAFLVYPNNSKITQKNFNGFVDSLMPIFNNKMKNHFQINLKNKAEFTNFSVYEEWSEKIFNEYILSNLTLSQEEFNLLRKDIESKDFTNSSIMLCLIETFWPYKKKIRTFFHTISLIYTKLCPNQNQNELFFLDATSSGLQVISMFLKDKTLGNISNLTGNNYCDIYKNCSLEFLSFINKMSADYIPYFFSNPNSDLKSSFEVLFRLLNNKNKIIPTELGIVNFQDINFFIKKMYTVDFMKEILTKALFSFTWMIKNFKNICIEYDKALENKIISEIEYKFIISCLVINSYKNIMDKFLKTNVPFEILTSREVFKALIMPSPYNITVFGSRRAIKKIFTQYLIKKNIQLDRYALIDVAAFIENYYSLIFKKKYLSHIEDYLAIGNYLAKSNKELNITNEYLSWKFRPEKTSIVRFNVRKFDDMHKRRQVSCAVQTGVVDPKAFKRSFCAIYVHACDANIVHRYLDLIYQINCQLKKYKITLYCDTIHDSFGINSTFALLLKPILLKVYNDFYTSNFREMLQKDLNEQEKAFIKKIIEKNAKNSFAEIKNKNFVKF